MESKSYAISDPKAPAEDSDAGNDGDLEEARLAEVISVYSSAAKHHFTKARNLLANRKRSKANTEARLAIDSVVRAFWWAEDTALEPEHHELMHTLGRWTRTHLGCHLHFDGQQYSHTCLIRIAHKRFGLSPGYVAQLICSICGQDLSECDHVVGRSYWVRGGAAGDRPCRICFDQTCVRHKPDRLYRAPVVKVITQVEELREISWVGRPANPEARLAEIPVESADLSAKFGPSFVTGAEVNCDFCLLECRGFDELPAEEPL